MRHVIIEACSVSTDLKVLYVRSRAEALLIGSIKLVSPFQKTASRRKDHRLRHRMTARPQKQLVNETLKLLLPLSGPRTFEL